MITKDEIQELLHSTETYRVERTTSTGDMDKFQEAICAFANDLPNSRKNGYLISGAHDNGNLPAEFNVNLITAFKVDVKVSQSYTNENGGKTGGKVGGDVPSLSQALSLVLSPVERSAVEEDSICNCLLVEGFWLYHRVDGLCWREKQKQVPSDNP